MRSSVEIEFSLGCDFHFSFENIEAALQDPSRFCVGSTSVVGLSGRGQIRGLGKFLGKSKERRFERAHKYLKRLVAGGGFEPPTFGL